MTKMVQKENTNGCKKNRDQVKTREKLGKNVVKTPIKWRKAKRKKKISFET